MDVAHAILFARKLDVSRLTVRYLSAKFELVMCLRAGRQREFCMTTGKKGCSRGGVARYFSLQFVKFVPVDHVAMIIRYLSAIPKLYIRQPSYKSLSYKQEY